MAPTDDLAALAASTQRFLSTVDAMDVSDLVAPSRLPGWSRLHVLTHVAAQSRTGCATGCSWRTPAGRWRSTRRWPFALPTSRPARSATRTWCASTSALPASDWRSTPRASPSDDWARDAGVGDLAGQLPAAGLPRSRLHEVEIHHVDLGAGYTFAQTPETVLRTFFDRVPAKFAGTASRTRAVSRQRTWARAGRSATGVAPGPGPGPLPGRVGNGSRGNPDDLDVGPGRPVLAAPGWG